MSSAQAVEYNPDAEWDGTIYTVASLLAYRLMAQHFGYEYVYSLEMGSHAFFVRSDLLHEADLGLPLRAVAKRSHLPDTQERKFVDVAYDFACSKSANCTRTAEVDIWKKLARGDSGTGSSELALAARELHTELMELRVEVQELHTSIRAAS